MDISVCHYFFSFFILATKFNIKCKHSRCDEKQTIIPINITRITKKNEPKINGITHAEQSSAQCDRIKSEHANLPHVLAHKIRVSKQYTLLCQNKPEFLVSQL